MSEPVFPFIKKELLQYQYFSFIYKSNFIFALITISKLLHYTPEMIYENISLKRFNTFV